MLRTPQFYVLYAMFLMMATGGLLVTANAGPIAAAWSIPVSFLALATSLNAVANGGSRIFWGWVSDKTGRELAMGIAFALQAICLVLVLTVGRLSGTLFAVTLVATFFTWGEVFSLFPSLIADYYGTKCSTANYGVLYSAKGVASIIGGGLAAMLFEKFGSWTRVLLRQRRAGAGRVGDRLQPARVESPERGRGRRAGDGEVDRSAPRSSHARSIRQSARPGTHRRATR